MLGLFFTLIIKDFWAMESPFCKGCPGKVASEAIIFDDVHDSFCKGLIWSPDGSAAMVPLEPDEVCFVRPDRALLDDSSFYESDSTSSEQNLQTKSVSATATATEIATGSGAGTVFSKAAAAASSAALAPCHRQAMGGSLIDCKWYPFMNAADPTTCCYVTTARDSPIHIWNLPPTSTSGSSSDSGSSSVSSNGGSRCSYRCYNQYDEIETCQTVAFNNSGDRIYAGLRDRMQVFDVARPGRDSTTVSLVRYKRDPLAAFRGLISCTEFAPAASGMHSVYACGTFTNHVAVFQEGRESSPALVLRDVPVGRGITCMRWSPDGNHLWVGGRCCEDIVCYDLRSTRGELGRVRRQLSSNQRMTFDLDPWGGTLAAGSQTGEVLLYDAKTFELLQSFGRTSGSSGNNSDNDNGGGGGGGGRGWDWDCVNAVSFHPYSAVLGMSTGQRHFREDFGSDSSDSENDSGAARVRSGSGSERRRREHRSGVHLLQLQAAKLPVPANMDTAA